MVDHLQRYQGQIGPIQPKQPATTPAATTETGKTQSFGQILNDQIAKADLKFSVHAQERIQFRNIPMGEADVERLKSAVNEVAEKGGRESLILMNNSAFVVSVQNRTVITALDQASLKNNVFTNIDSAVIV